MSHNLTKLKQKIVAKFLTFILHLPKTSCCTRGAGTQHVQLFWMFIFK